MDIKSNIIELHYVRNFKIVIQELNSEVNREKRNILTDTVCNPETKQTQIIVISNLGRRKIS